MTEQQKAKFVAALVEHQSEFEGLSNEEAQWGIQQTKAVIAVVVSAIKVAHAKLSQILEFVGLVTVPATTLKFVASEKFVINTNKDAPVKISGLGENFKTQFLDKVEEPLTEQELWYHRLKQSSADGPIITELGGEANVETTLSEMFSLMKAQGKGQAGVLLNNGYANIFYIKDVAGVLCAVYVYWNDRGWDIDANSVEYPYGWLVGSHVFSRNS